MSAREKGIKRLPLNRLSPGRTRGGTRKDEKEQKGKDRENQRKKGKTKEKLLRGTDKGTGLD